GQLESGLEKAKGLDNFYAIAIIYKGRLIVEEYANGDRKTLYPVWSVTKSVLSALVGQSIDKGYLENETKSIASFFPDVADSIKRKITVKHLLTMSSGISDNTGYMSEAYPLQFILDKDLLYPSGTWWNYTSAGTHVLSYLFTAATEKSASNFALNNLFSQIGVSDYLWIEDAYGISNGGFGLRLHLVDMAKFGQLFLQSGQSLGKEVISSTWVKKSFDMTIPFNEEKSSGYGYLWWMRLLNGEKMIYAAGYGGQYIMVVPTRALVVAITSSSRYSGEYGNDLNRIFYDDIIGSFSRVDLQ
ncbi:MAG: beta-lactamase family protein, partial [Candidatus Marinimicrobia bacterium]|nr:beta-lactamase family protein [Candidatus Neomarinimicrobiota bacterium]